MNNDKIAFQYYIKIVSDVYFILLSYYNDNIKYYML